jgi:hypothetical protein
MGAYSAACPQRRCDHLSHNYDEVVGGAFRCGFSERRRGYPVGRIEPCGGGRDEVLFWDVSGTNGVAVAGCLLYFAP